MWRARLRDVIIILSNMLISQRLAQRILTHTLTNVISKTVVIFFLQQKNRDSLEYFNGYWLMFSRPQTIFWLLLRVETEVPLHNMDKDGKAQSSL